MNTERIYYSREAERRAQRDRLIMAVVVSGFGIGVGAILALLLAPRPGEETRRQLGETLDQAVAQGTETAADAAAQAARTVREGAGKLQAAVSDRVEQASKR